MKKIPILTYHSQNISGNAYQTNDHIALREDLRAVYALGFRIVPVSWIVEWILGYRDDSQLSQVIALTFDDGTNFDYFDIDHPQHGFQQSFFIFYRNPERKLATQRSHTCTLRSMSLPPRRRGRILSMVGLLARVGCRIAGGKRHMNRAYSVFATTVRTTNSPKSVWCVKNAGRKGRST